MAQEAPPEPQEPEACSAEIRSAAANNTIYFETARASILNESFGLLDQIVATAFSCPEARFEVIGHTDSDGSDDFNQQLSEARAIAVVNYLTRSGVDANRLVPVGFGETKPVAPNDTDENKALNRRIEFGLIGSQG